MIVFDSFTCNIAVDTVQGFTRRLRRQSEFLTFELLGSVLIPYGWLGLIAIQEIYVNRN